MRVVFGLVPDYRAIDEINDIFGNVGRLVRNSFEMPRNAEQVNQRFKPIRVAANAFLDLFVHLPVDRIDFVVRPDHLFS